MSASSSLVCPLAPRLRASELVSCRHTEVQQGPLRRRRLRLQALEPLLQTPDVMTQRRIDVALRMLPSDWSMRADMAREEIAWTLQSLSANALELASLWTLHGFQNKLLMETGGPKFLAKAPMDAAAFELLQHECHDRVKASLWTHWLPKSAEVFRLIPPVCINGDADAYYRSIATLQGRQLRQLVQASIDAYVALFEKHPGARLRLLILLDVDAAAQGLEPLTCGM